MKTYLATLVVSLLASTNARADVLIVDASGNGDFLDLPEAVNAAQHGDTLLVRPGSYSTPTLLDKGLRVVADVDDTVIVVGQLVVTAIPPTNPLLFSGLELQGVPNAVGESVEVVHIMNSPGAVRFDGCTILGYDGEQYEHGGDAVIVTNSHDVAFISSVLRAGDGGIPCYDYGFFTLAGVGLRVSNSSVSLFRTLVFGGDGGYGYGECPGGPAGEGALIENGSAVFAMYDYFKGGDGGGTDDYIGLVCSPGQPGVRIKAGSVLHEQAGIFVGGKGGYSWVFDAYCDDAAGIEGAGTVDAMLGNHRALIAPRVVRGGEQYDLEIYGLAGDRAYVFWSPSTDAVFRPRVYGIWLLFGPGLAKYQGVGTLNGNGYLKVPMDLPEFGDGIEEHLMYAQLMVRDIAGTAFIGSPVAIQALDSGL